MKEWFKARNIWGAALNSLTDEEAGKVAKAIWNFTMNGEKTELSGNGKAVFALIFATLSADEEEMQNLSRVRAEAGSKGGKQRQAKQAIASLAKQNQANSSNCHNKNKNINNNELEEEKEPFGGKPLELTADDIGTSIARDNMIEAEARSIGLQVTEAGMMRGRDLAEKYGLSETIAAIKKAIDRPTWAYVEGILKKGGVNNNDGHKTSFARNSEEPRTSYEFLRGADAV